MVFWYFYLCVCKFHQNQTNQNKEILFPFASWVQFEGIRELYLLGTLSPLLSKDRLKNRAT